MKVVPIISDPDYRLSDAKERLISLCEDMGIPVEVKRHAWHKNMQEHHEYWTGLFYQSGTPKPILLDTK